MITLLQMQVNMPKTKQHSCSFCGNQYTRKTSFERHFVVCEILHTNTERKKREEMCEKEETTDVPNLVKMYKIIQELAAKNAALEKKVDLLATQIVRKNKKIDVLQIINSRQNQPTNEFYDWIYSFDILEENIQMLVNDNLCKTIMGLFKSIINLKEKQQQQQQQQQQLLPICCFSHLPNTFYIYLNNKDKWIKMELSVLSTILKQIHYKILLALTNWYSKNTVKINQSDKEQIVYNNTIKKLMVAELDESCLIFNKIKNELYTLLNVKFE